MDDSHTPFSWRNGLYRSLFKVRKARCLARLTTHWHILLFVTTMHLICFISLAAFLTGVAGNPLSSRAMEVHESVAAVPKGFAHAGPVSPSEEITLRISLAHSDIAGLEKMTYAVSDPAS